jgi:hypothetical protein
MRKNKFIMFSVRSLIYIFVALLLCQLVGKFGIVDSPMFGGIYGQVVFGFCLSLNTIIISAIQGEPKPDGGKARVEITEEELNVNESIARYKAMLKKGKENSKWWQFWI